MEPLRRSKRKKPEVESTEKLAAMEPVWHRIQEPVEATIIPGLPQDVALRILALLPCAFYSALSLVAHSWLYALRPDGPVTALRKRLNISETWLVFVSAEYPDVEFLFVDPAHNGRLSVVRPLPYTVKDPSFLMVFVNRHTVATGKNILIPQPYGDANADAMISGSGSLFHCFDVQSMQWKGSVSNCRPLLGFYATAAVDECLYVVGGISGSRGLGLRKVSRRVDKLNMMTRSWEILPDLQEERSHAVALLHQGRLCVVGGFSAADKPVYSGEMWDPKDRKWTLMVELWPPSDIQNTWCITSVKGTLYALTYSRDEDVQELWYFEGASRLWISIGKFCFQTLVKRESGGFQLYENTRSFFRMLGGEEQLLVVCRAKPPRGIKCQRFFTFVVILSVKPTLLEPITWKVSFIKHPVATSCLTSAEPLILHV